jgi:hypothetical protein
MESWPANKNPVLTVYREGIDKGDKWGSNLSFLFALCDIAVDYGIPIPGELEFRQGIWGSDTDSYEYQAIEGLLKEGEYIYAPLTQQRFDSSVSQALKVLGRYDSLLRLAREDY